MKTKHIIFLALLAGLLLETKLYGQIFVGNEGNNTIGEYTMTGAPVVSGTLVSSGLLNEPRRIAVSGSDLFVTNEGSNTIGEYTTTGGTVNASLVSGLHTPQGIAIIPEPSTWALIVAGAGLLIFAFRWRVKA